MCKMGSSKARCSRDQKQPRHNDSNPKGTRDGLSGRCDTLDGDGCRHDSHRAKVHNPDDKKDRHQTSTALGAVESKAHAVSPGHT